MRIPLLKPSELTQEQKAVYESIQDVAGVSFKNFKFMKEGGTDRSLQCHGALPEIWGCRVGNE